MKLTQIIKKAVLPLAFVGLSSLFSNAYGDMDIGRMPDDHKTTKKSIEKALRGVDFVGELEKVFEKKRREKRYADIKKHCELFSFDNVNLGISLGGADYKDTSNYLHEYQENLLSAKANAFIPFHVWKEGKYAASLKFNLDYNHTNKVGLSSKIQIGNDFRNIGLNFKYKVPFEELSVYGAELGFDYHFNLTGKGVYGYGLKVGFGIDGLLSNIGLGLKFKASMGYYGENFDLIASGRAQYESITVDDNYTEAELKINTRIYDFYLGVSAKYSEINDKDKWEINSSFNLSLKYRIHKSMKICFDTFRNESETLDKRWYGFMLGIEL